MYFDFDSRTTKRDGWTYTYTGGELLRHVDARLAEYAAKVREARNRVADLMRDEAVPATSPAVEDAKNAVESQGRVLEQLQVWSHELGRAPAREYTLGLGDVVFFGLAAPAARP